MGEKFIKWMDQFIMPRPQDIILSAHDDKLGAEVNMACTQIIISSILSAQKNILSARVDTFGHQHNRLSVRANNLCAQVDI